MIYVPDSDEEDGGTADKTVEDLADKILSVFPGKRTSSVSALQKFCVVVGSRRVGQERAVCVPSSDVEFNYLLGLVRKLKSQAAVSGERRLAARARVHHAAHWTSAT